MKLNALEAFLDDYCEEGMLDSHGTFTLNWSHALEKLGKYQSEAPGLWLVKLLQCAVSSGASDFLVRFGVRGTRVQFTTNSSSEDAIAALSSLHPCSNATLEHLQVGIQSLCTIPNCRASIRLINQGSVVDFPIIQGVLDRPTEQRESSYTGVRSGSRIEVVRTYEQISLFNYFKILGRQQDEILFLKEMGRFAPLRLQLDGRLINDPVVNKPPGLRLGVWVNPLGERPRPAIPYATLERIVLSDSDSPAMALADHSLRSAKHLWVGAQVQSSLFGSHAFCQQWVHESLPLAPPLATVVNQRRPPYRHFHSKIERADGAFELWPDYNTNLPAILARGYLSLDLNKGRPGRIYLVKDGVALKHKPLGSLYPNCLAVWCANQVKTDLSQLQVVEDEAYEKVLNEVRGHFKMAAQGLLDQEVQEQKNFLRMFQGSREEVLATARRIVQKT